MSHITTAPIGTANAPAKPRPPKKRPAVLAKSYRRSTRLAEKIQPSPEQKPKPIARKQATSPNTTDIAKDFHDRLDAISRQLALLTVGSPPLPSLPSPIPISRPRKDISAELQDAVSSFDSERTLPDLPVYPISDSHEKDTCREIFAPTARVPKPEELSMRLRDNLVAPIPIHHFVYNLLKPVVDSDILEANFCIAEKVGNLCPRLTPCVERALMINNVNVGTESMQQHVLDAFLMGIIGTAQEHLAIDIKIDRNAAESSMTLPQCRPDFLLIMNGQLVFKGEEKKGGDIRHIALELVDKMIPGSVGSKGKLEYLLGYATAGSRVLFNCIYGDHAMIECSSIIDLMSLPNRVTLVIMLVNVVRITHALMLAKDT